MTYYKHLFCRWPVKVIVQINLIAVKDSLTLCSVWARTLSPFCFRRRIIPAEKNRRRLCIHRCTRKTVTLPAMYHAEAGNNCRQWTRKPELIVVSVRGSRKQTAPLLVAKCWTGLQCGVVLLVLKKRPSFFLLYAGRGGGAPSPPPWQRSWASPWRGRNASGRAVSWNKVSWFIYLYNGKLQSQGTLFFPPLRIR